MNKSKFRINYNSITKLCKVLTFITLSLFLANCEDKNPDIYIIIKDENGQGITGDTVSVSVNSVHQTLIDVAFKVGSPKYLRQIDQGNIEQLNGQKDYELISNGINSSGSDFEKVIITTSFSDTLVHIGSIVKISVRVDTDMVESAFYKVTQ